MIKVISIAYEHTPITPDKQNMQNIYIKRYSIKNIVTIFKYYNKIYIKSIPDDYVVPINQLFL